MTIWMKMEPSSCCLIQYTILYVIITLLELQYLNILLKIQSIISYTVVNSSFIIIDLPQLNFLKLNQFIFPYRSDNQIKSY